MQCVSGIRPELTRREAAARWRLHHANKLRVIPSSSNSSGLNREPIDGSTSEAELPPTATEEVI